MQDTWRVNASPGSPAAAPLSYGKPPSFPSPLRLAPWRPHLVLSTARVSGPGVRARRECAEAGRAEAPLLRKEWSAKNNPIADTHPPTAPARAAPCCAGFQTLHFTTSPGIGESWLGTRGAQTAWVQKIAPGAWEALIFHSLGSVQFSLRSDFSPPPSDGGLLFFEFLDGQASGRREFFSS
jgi:hypothetical protein